MDYEGIGDEIETTDPRENIYAWAIILNYENNIPYLRLIINYNESVFYLQLSTLSTTVSHSAQFIHCACAR